MTARFLAGVAVAALVLTAASGAMANPKNSFSNGNGTFVSSSAGASSVEGTASATSESFNQSIESVSLQTLTQFNSGQGFPAGVVAEGGSLDMSVVLGGSVQRNAAGIVQASAQSGFQTQTQQAASVAAVGTVNIAGGENGAE